MTVAVSAAACALTLRGLLRWAVIDAPNHRSSHTRPTPRGGGLGFMVVVLIGWTALWLTGSPSATPAVIAGAAAIAAISFVDDLRGAPLIARLAVQAAAVFLALATFPTNTPILAGFLPLALDRIIVALAWLWFINLFNFMDGIDGIAAGEAAVISFGLVLLAALFPALGLASPEAIVIGAAVTGFLLFNWPPARVFMGDIGSAGLGFLLGWLLIIAASKGALVPALLLPLYFAADASLTLAIRDLAPETPRHCAPRSRLSACGRHRCEPRRDQCISAGARSGPDCTCNPGRVRAADSSRAGAGCDRCLHCLAKAALKPAPGPGCDCAAHRSR